MVEDTLFSQIDKIFNISEVAWVGTLHLISVFPGSRTEFKRPYRHILVSSKGDKTYKKKRNFLM